MGVAGEGEQERVAGSEQVLWAAMELIDALGFGGVASIESSGLTGTRFWSCGAHR